MKSSELSLGLERFSTNMSHAVPCRTAQRGAHAAHDTTLPPALRALWCVVLHGRMLARQQAEQARMERVLAVLEALSREALSPEARRNALQLLREAARTEGGLMATALDVIESHEPLRDAA